MSIVQEATNIQKNIELSSNIQDLQITEVIQNVQKQQKPKINTQTMKQYLSVLTTGPQDTYDEISQEDIKYLQQTKYQIALYPLCTFLGLTALKKAVDFIRVPEILRNPLLPPKVNVQRGQYFKKFMSKNILLLACVTSTMGGFALYEINKYYMYLKYKNLVESYLDSCEREYLNNLKQEGEKVDLFKTLQVVKQKEE